MRASRDNRIDALLKEHVQAHDPMADAEPEIEDRSAALQEADLPPVITVNLPEFKLGEVVHPATSLAFLVTHKKINAPALECTGKCLNW